MAGSKNKGGCAPGALMVLVAIIVVVVALLLAVNIMKKADPHNLPEGPTPTPSTSITPSPGVTELPK